MTRMNLKQGVSLMAGFSIALLASHTTPARANFTWLPPVQTPVAAPVHQEAASAANMNGVPQMPAQKVAPIQEAPLSVAPPKNVPPPVENISGFASDVPLSLALEQVVPPGYKVVLAHGVKSGTNVSWKGGQPWQQVLSAMLAPVKLHFDLQGNDLTIKKGAQSSQSVASSAPIPVAPSAEDTSSEVMAPPPSPGVIPEAPAKAAIALPVMAAPATSEALPPVAPAPEAAAPAASSNQESAQSEQADVIPPAWSAQKGETLKTVLGAWAKAAHVRLYWAIDYDYRLNKDVAYGGSFAQASARLFNMFADAAPQPYGQLYANSASGNVLVVRIYGNNN